MQKKYSPLALVLLIVLGALWGTGYTIVRYVVTHGVDPLGYAVWQTLGPLLFLLAIQLGVRRKIPNYALTQARFYLFCGLIGITIPNTNVYFTARHLPSGILAVIMNISSILTYLFAWMLRLEKFALLRFGAVVLGFIGIMLLIIPKATLGGMNTLPWAILALLSPICFSTVALYIAKNSFRNQDVLDSSIGMLAVASLCLVPLAIFTHQVYIPHFPLKFVDWLILLEIVLSGCGYLVLFKLLKVAGPAYYSLVDSVTIAIALMWGFIFFSEKLNAFSFIAVMLILVAVILIGFSKHAQNN